MRRRRAAAFILAGVVLVAAVVAFVAWRQGPAAAVAILPASGPYLIADPNPVPASGQMGVTQLFWSTGDDTIGQITVLLNGGDETAMVGAPSGSVEVPWIQPKHTYEFRLYRGLERQELLASLEVVQERGLTNDPGARGNLAVAIILGILAVLALWVHVRGRQRASDVPVPTGEMGPVKKLDAITSLRFVAAAMIVVSHSVLFFDGPNRQISALNLQVGVTFFFVLSGFILTYVYPTLPRRAVPRFWLARFARIWPAHAFCFLLACLLIPIGAMYPAARPETAIANLALVHAWIPSFDFYFSINAPSWSVSDELAFYLLFPLLLAGLERTWAWKLLISASAAGAAVILGNTLLPSFPLDGAVTTHGVIYINPLARQLEFVLGMCLCLLWRKIRDAEQMTTHFWTFAEVAAVGAVIAVLVLASRPVWGEWLGDGSRVWIRNSGTAVGFCVLILVVAIGRGWLSRLLALPPFVLLGEISYSIYLTHLSVFHGFSTYARDLPLWIGYPLFGAAIIGLSYVTWRLVERPARQYLTSLGGGSPTNPVRVDAGVEIPPPGAVKADASVH